MLWPIFSCFRSVLRRSFVFSHSGHRTSTSVSLSLCGGGEESALGSINYQLVLRNCSAWLRNCWVWSFVFLLSELDEVLDKLNQGPSTSRPLIVETTDTSGDDTNTSQPRRSVRSKPTFKMKNSAQVMSWLGFLWPVPPMLPQNWVNFTAGYAEKTYLSSPMAVQRSYGICKGSGILREINASVLRLLGGVFWVSTASLWLKMSWRGSVRRFCGLP